MERTSTAVFDFLARERYDDVMLLGTESLRSASNAGEFRRIIREKSGLKTIVLSGQKEAHLTFLGALYGLGEKGRKIMVVDVGGGSTEISIGNHGEFSHAVSVPVGAAGLLMPGTDDSLIAYTIKAEKIIMDIIGGFDLGKTDQLIVAGGTITSISAIHKGMKKYDPRAIHGAVLSVEDIMAAASRFEGMERVNREKLIPLDPQRADLILPGTGIILAILGISEKNRLRVSTGGLRFGAVLEPELARK